MLFIPDGFAHGFVVLSDEAELLYKASGEYNPQADCGILWNDKDINIDWGIDFEPILSEKDKFQKTLKEFKTK
jgi:dTDP-4-dehydrorhamnose 3,5-epimerase